LNNVEAFQTIRQIYLELIGCYGKEVVVERMMNMSGPQWHSRKFDNPFKLRSNNAAIGSPKKGEEKQRQLFTKKPIG